MPRGDEQPSGNPAAGPFPVLRLKVAANILPAVRIMDARRDMGGRSRAESNVDLDFLKPDQHRFEILARRLRWCVSMLTDRPIAGQPQLQFHT